MKVRRTTVPKDEIHPHCPPLPVSGLGIALNAITQQAQGTRIMSFAKGCHEVGFVGTRRTDASAGLLNQPPLPIYLFSRIGFCIYYMRGRSILWCHN